MSLIHDYPSLRDLLPEEAVLPDAPVAHHVHENAHYLVITITQEEAAGQYLVRVDDKGAAELLHVDTLAFPLPADIHLPEAVERSLVQQVIKALKPALSADELAANVASFRSHGFASTPVGGLVDWLRNLFPTGQERAPHRPARDEADISARLFAAARNSVGMSTVEGPDRGNLACVWALRRIFQQEFGRSLTQSNHTGTFQMELAGGTGREVAEINARPGHIIISPTGSGRGVGHVGVLGENGNIYSNSSRRARWEQNHTLQSWRRRYVNEQGMRLHFYQVTARTAGLTEVGGNVRSLVANAPQPAIADASTPTQDLEISDEAIEMLRHIHEYWAQQESPMLAMARSARIPLVAEGDSWFDFKIAPDVIDWLERDYGYAIKNFAQAGACMYEMAYDRKDAEADPTQLMQVVQAIRTHRPRAVLLSGGGNDFAGPEFILTIHHRFARKSGVNHRVIEALFEDEVMPAYRLMIETITGAAVQAGLGKLPILVHGYDYPYPDGRRAVNIFGMAGIGPWMDPSFRRKGYSRSGMEERRQHVGAMIDALYGMLRKLSDAYPHVHVVNVLGTLQQQRDWHDELHPTREGFRAVARKFHETLQRVLG